MLRLPVIATLLTACQSACYAPESKTPVSVAANANVFELISQTYVCTAWVVDAPHGVSDSRGRYDAHDLALTAGHCCDGHAGETMELTTADGLSVPARPLVWEESYGPEADLCVMQVLGPAARGLQLADAMPAPFAAERFTGYPDGKRSTVDGLYLGVLDGAVYGTAVGIPGASGSPLYTDAGVFGLVNQIVPTPDGSGSMGSSGTPLAEIRRVLALVE